jgi:hypothetical protein
MKRSLAIRPVDLSLFLAVMGILACTQPVMAHSTGQQHVHFQKPRSQKSAGTASNQKIHFQSASQASTPQRESSSRHVRKSRAEKPQPSAHQNPLRNRPSSDQRQDTSAERTKPKIARVQKKTRPARPSRQVELASHSEPVPDRSSTQDPFPVTHIARKLQQHRQIRHTDQVAPVAHGEIVYESGLSGACDYCGSEGACEPGCGLVETSCGIGEPGCGIMEPGCGIVEPGCGIVEPGCGIVDECGSCVGPPIPDYWCFPVCLPRFKVFTAWAGVHSFRDARDFITNDSGNANYGFQEGVNIGGRAPLIGRFFPQLGYQLGYQAVQSRLSGTTTRSNTRSQNFVTFGLFRRVPVGLQFGAAWDFLQNRQVEDASQAKTNLQQIRYEISLKTPRGREIGFTAATHLNSRELSLGIGAAVTYQTVDQYLLFYRWHFRNKGVGRCWVGGTDDNEAILGADFQVPLNDRWSLQSGFNYLIPDQKEVRQEAWNLGMNLVWHWGRTARTGRSNPYSSLFPVADNGWMFVDRAP